ncbi:hypothetical protein BDZ45DRAFT_740169 [Acephala macrosclerotiorum]|nr:hypothetical protein BDZ45DRAFT_740169 [Acephala macrosclerotiorum]
MSTPNANQASMLGGHAQYAKGYVEETESGRKDTQEGISEMKAANQKRSGEPAASGIGGKIEQVVGQAAGCERQEKANK